MLGEAHNATGAVAALPFLLAGAAATPRSIATALVFQQLHCYESNPATSGCRPTRNNCVSGFAELDGLYISCQPQRLSCFVFFPPLSPDHVALASQPAVRLLHAEIPATYQRSHFKPPVSWTCTRSLSRHHDLKDTRVAV